MARRTAARVLGAVLLGCGTALEGCGPGPVTPAPKFTLEIREDAGAPGRIELIATAPVPWDEIAADEGTPDWPAVLAIGRDDGADAEGGPIASPVAGTYEVTGEILAFRPGVPLMEGVRYRARLDPGALPGGGFAGAEPIERFTAFQLPRTAPEREVRLKIYPGGDVLPANFLKFYLVFSEPMRRGEGVFNFLKIVREDGGEVPDPFRDTELWSEDGTRFTLWLHPGRQKDGVNLNVEIGPVLEEGRSYRLIVSKDWKAESGAAMGADVEKAFAAGPADRERPAPGRWTIEAPGAGTREPLILRFPEPLDWALLRSRVRVEDSSGAAVDGNAETGGAETSWSLTPSRPWAAGRYRVAVDTVLEDLAGNSVARLFERAAGEVEADGGEVVHLEVEPR